MSSETVVLHVTSAAAWEAARAAGSYAIPPGPDGAPAPFTHLCTREQLPGVLERFYPGSHEGLVLLEIDPAGLPIVVEAADDGAGDFPHLYGPLPVASVVGVAPLA